MDSLLQRIQERDTLEKINTTNQADNITDHDALAKLSRNELRSQVIARRGAMSEESRATKSRALCELLLAKLHELKPSSHSKTLLVAVYSAFPKEVQLDFFIREAYKQNVRVAFPCMVKDSWGVKGSATQTMEMREVSEQDYLNGSVEFLLHPLRSYHHFDNSIAKYPYISANEIDFLICPLVAFDKNNNRLGYGGGNYDRYLTQLKDTTIVGIAFSEQEIYEVPTEEHDIPIPIVSL